MPPRSLRTKNGRVLRPDRAPDLVEEPPAEARPASVGRETGSRRLRASAPGTTTRGSARAWRRTCPASCFSSAPSGSQSATMIGRRGVLDARRPRSSWASRRYQVSGQVASPATVIDRLPGGHARLRASSTDVERADEVLGRLDVGEHLGVAWAPSRGRARRSGSRRGSMPLVLTAQDATRARRAARARTPERAPSREDRRQQGCTVSQDFSRPSVDPSDRRPEGDEAAARRVRSRSARRERFVARPRPLRSRQRAAEAAAEDDRGRARNGSLRPVRRGTRRARRRRIAVS